MHIHISINLICSHVFVWFEILTIFANMFDMYRLVGQEQIFVNCLLRINPNELFEEIFFDQVEIDGHDALGALRVIIIMFSV